MLNLNLNTIKSALLTIALTYANYAHSEGFWIQKSGDWAYEPSQVKVTGPSTLTITGGGGVSCKTPNYNYLGSSYKEIFKYAPPCPSELNNSSDVINYYTGGIIQYAWSVLGGEIEINGGKSGYKNTYANPIPMLLEKSYIYQTNNYGAIRDRGGYYRPGSTNVTITTTYPDGAQQALLRVGNGLSANGAPVMASLNNETADHFVIDYIVHNGIVYPSDYVIPTCQVSPASVNIDHGVLSIHTATNHSGTASIQITCTGNATGEVRVVSLNNVTMDERLMASGQKIDEYVGVELDGGGMSNLQIRTANQRGTLIPFNVYNGSITLDVTSELRDVTTPGMKRGQAILNITYQ
ncbi:hypothetical protein O4O00_23490 [Citrobacter sedlakii]|uniref:hypothetical protein n=1 Tax=Citrobacter sedlakii TaxID=67826 RepID=UPI0022B5D976|nr:hypothetical protein [Citrobacter sedlakii]MCZ4677300.1 hypothetical protein [Citrobacter sedlakii]MDR5007357.1 hypothetical protein [Citrobacter sedlakii]